MKGRIFTVLILFLHTISPAQQNIEQVFQKLLTGSDYKNATIGIQVSDLDSDEILFNFDNNKLMIPASTMKLVTSAAALEILGAHYRFTTKIGYTGNINKNTLNGDLVVVGGGDPVLGSAHFRDFYEHPDFLDIWVQKIKDAGIQKIKGDLVLDVSLYDSEKIPPTWIWEDMGNYYGAGPSALSVYDNMFRITFSSPGKAGMPTQIVSTYPKIEGLEIQNEVLSSDENRDLAFVFGSPLDYKRVIRGTIPKNRKSFTIKASDQNPEKLLAADFISHLAKSGIFISGGVKLKKVDGKEFQIVYIQESPSLAEIAKVLNYESVNLIAEHLVKQIAVQKTGEGSREKGIAVIKQFWKSKGLEGQFFMEDGSGLSHFNAISPGQFISLLKYMRNQSKYSAAFLNSLPGAANGTLYGFDARVFEGNTLKAKSGSMTRVRCYAGYLKVDSGKTVAFSLMVNQFDGSHSKLIGEIQKLFEAAKITF
ncbi:D-alanyl-D-alanine carboxypeptidase/D-alanyl-D-alanine-endopeptidase [Maribellus comscasis]|uniref:D-alanyl-D-alanine carboxypeptidase/D-alanyl-D-alanine-endopeptidase n=1 Tax=Maribellus comscasis TaxID=2681766 RepID=A0A6I6K3A8_9BACT|nr:D-alanyl-D-alanine carboxypeptidase/D-alanyl-D-alanine-endopeptidase [Maribellus comscasis]QGY47037.1 D-alanyl-D-alanine carboxypeptidase/D-alanyl-D-alanine-endopeptidase [Maribellus comscasis]